MDKESKAKIILTGVTSFTGCHIAKTLIESSHEVVTPLLRSKDEYKDIKRSRLSLCDGMKVNPNVDIGSSNFIDFVKKIQPNVFINHGAYIQDYRSEDFDFLKHLEVNLKNIKNLVQTLKDNGCDLFIHSGSAFEPGGEYSRFGISPYGVAKKMVWDMTIFWCNRLELPCTKVVIPNPYGLYENEDRLLPSCHRKILNREKIVLTDSETLRNNIRVEDLAKVYVRAIEDFVLRNKYELIVKPKGYIETQKQFVIRALQGEPYNLSRQRIEECLVCK